MFRGLDVSLTGRPGTEFYDDPEDGDGLQTLRSAMGASATTYHPPPQIRPPQAGLSSYRICYGWRPSRTDLPSHSKIRVS
jgi:hypothetical protein